ncbi:hypothetical protein OUZ56_032872 [Daphnia magna]|uniref:Uncharacterized protein n=1 Tax=Daphnia magna TaxID=35525 RepID=A0ABR0B9S9_9CRUS|nr:hypothetical protein OUZ56_032872 [Daphnia magna]
MDRSSKRPAACSSSWAQKKKHSRDTPVSEFKELTAMGSKGEEYFGLLEIGKSYMLKNGVVVRKGGRESSYSWMIENQFYLKTDAHSSITLNSKGGVPDMVYKFVPLESIASINDGQVIDTFGYVCDIGGMTTSVVHESFCDNMLLLISGMGFRRGHCFGRSGIQEDSIVAIKGVKIERRVEGTQDWIGPLFDDSSFVVKELLPEAHAIWMMKEGDSSEQVGECNAGADEVCVKDGDKDKQGGSCGVVSLSVVDRNESSSEDRVLCPVSGKKMDVPK